MSDTLFEVEASHAIYVNRLASKQVNDLNSFWFSYLKSMQSALENYAPDMRKAELNKLIKDIDEIILFNMADMQEQTFLDLDEFAEYETQFQAKAIGAAAGQSLALPATEQVIAAAIANPFSVGKAGAVDLRSELNDLPVWQKKHVSDTIRLGYANGVTTPEIIRQIIGTKSNPKKPYGDGLLDIPRNRLSTITRTAVNHYATTARRAVYEKNKNVVIGIRIIATLDMKTSDPCRKRDGQEFYFADNKTIHRPPYHYGCRTSDVPIIKGRPRNLTGERASKGGELVDGKLKSDPKPVSSAIDYYEFLAKQPAEFQDNVLGKTIGKAFRNSGVTPTEFQAMALKQINKPMTIANVASMDKKLLDYIESQRKK